MLTRLQKNPILLIPIIIVVIIGLAVGWWLASPLFINQTVSEDFPMLAQATLPAGMVAEDGAATMMSAAAKTTTMQDPMPETAPQAIKMGNFRNGDSFHTGSGQASIYQLADGSLVLRFENFTVINGPDLHVYLSGHPDPESSAQVNETFLDLGQLKGNIGSQNYTLPANTDLSQYNSVVIYCQPFHVVFSVAPLINAG